MARTSVAGFLGPSNTLTATNQDIERSSNLYLEPVAPGSGKTAAVFLRRAGLRPVTLVNDAPGACIFAQDGRCFCVVGTTFAEITSVAGVWSTTTYGTVTAASASLPASIVSNGTAGGQLLIVSGGNGYVFTLASNTFTAITTGTFPGTGFPVGDALMAEFMDGYGIVVQATTRTFFLSALEDFTSWDPLDVAERSEGSDNIVAMRRNHREIWILGTKTGEVWYDTGDALFPFGPVPGTFIENGAATWSMARLADSVAWLSTDERGNGIVQLANGYQPTRVSTHAVEESLATSADLTAARLFAHQQSGHLFLWVHVPDLPVTWVWDQTTNRWYDWSTWNTTTCEDEPHPACDHAFAFGVHLIVDWVTGNIYQLDPSVYDDAVVA